MKDSQPSLSRRRRDLYHVGNCTTTTIPLDLIIEILSLLPAKSLLQFQSVSKLWFSTIRSKTFVDSFLTRSKNRPRLLFTFYLKNSWEKFLFSAPEYDDDKSSSVLARYDMTISDLDEICGSVNGFVCFRSVVSSKPVCNNKTTVYNPTTRQIMKLPDVTSGRRYVDALIAYDTVEDQYKVFCVKMFDRKTQQQQEHFVCTVSSSQKQEWRKIENTTGGSYKCVLLGHIFIDGALYYRIDQSRIVRFDVRAEKIEIIKTPKESHVSVAYDSALIDYNGKLGRLVGSCANNLVTLWVLEDVEKQEWSSMTHAVPYQCGSIHRDRVFVVCEAGIHAGVTMMFRLPFRVCYYDLNKKNIREVEIRGMEDGDLRRVHGFGVLTGYTGHIENISFL
ncbi:hypothetical protein BRARA_C01018 [Brassica rapa]|uniref:F-box domain-containing protein n=1 Tax=Brassica campestris TaxID=3711 RepID=A0A397ZV80_BRACM|nr:hypothetical protein BRARA_C01018 [Brassica rapa]CAG7879742.1 unnamed protein product [Brassica rapa]VDC79182.1 unnamed protein product [Brassica rapa]